MRVNILVANDNGMFVDTLDLYSAKYRRAFVLQAAEELGVEQAVVIRFIQAMLGHTQLDTTAIYTQVSIAKLKEIHTATHPARLRRGERGDALADE